MPAHNKENISIAQMIQNPTGKASAFFASRARIKNQLDQIFIKNLRHYRREFTAVPYINENNHDIIWYVSVPSETFNLNRVKYDCIVEIVYDASLPLEHRKARFFTNSPSFIYTYAYVFNQEDLLPNFIKPNMPQLSLTQAPVIRNPIESRGFDKILYQALKYLTVGGCLSDDYINKFKQRWNTIAQAQVMRRCADTGTLVAIYQHAKQLDALRRGTARKKVTSQQQAAMQKQAQGYEKFKRSTSPTKVGFIVKRTPRSKITARGAARNINRITPKKKKLKTDY